MEYQVVAIGTWNKRVVEFPRRGDDPTNREAAYAVYSHYKKLLDEEMIDGLEWSEDGVICNPDAQPEVEQVAEIAPQIVVAEEELTPEQVQFNYEVRNDGFQYVKPKGGFWTSTNDRGSSEWMRWCEREMPEWLEGSRYVLVPNADARIYTISSLVDLEQLVAMYPRMYPVGNVPCIDFAAMQKEWDALHLTKEGEQAIHEHGKCALNNPLYQEEWSCESTVWFRWCFQSVEKL